MSEFDEDADGMSISERGQREDGWTFSVELGHGDGMIEYVVDVDREYWTRLTNRRIEPDELIAKTFTFLLDKESKEHIMKRFNLSDVAGHFPNYEMEIKRSL